MLIENINYDLMEQDLGNIERDYVPVEWYEVERKVLYKVSRNGVKIGIRNHEGRPLRNGGILWRDQYKALVVEILPCTCITLKPETMSEMGKACYELGNRHAPLFIEDGELLTPFDAPLFNVLEKYGFKAHIKTAALITPLSGHTQRRVHGHSHEDS